MKREHYLLVGLVLFFIGLQFRLVDSFTLSEKSSRFVSAQMGQPVIVQTLNAWPNAAMRKVVRPPRWIGLAFMSIGSVLALQGMALGKIAGNSH